MFAREKAKGICIVHHPKEEQDAKEAKRMLEKEGAETLMIGQDLAEGEAACKDIIDKVLLIITKSVLRLCILNLQIEFLLI